MTWTQNLGRVKGDRGSALVPTIVQTATDIAISWSPSDDKYDGPVPETIHFEPIYYIPYIDEDPQTGDVILKWTHNKANDPTAPNIVLPNDVSIKGEKGPRGDANLNIELVTYGPNDDISDPKRFLRNKYVNVSNPITTEETIFLLNNEAWVYDVDTNDFYYLEQTVNLSNYYNKDQTDNLFYNKIAIDNKLGSVASMQEAIISMLDNGIVNIPEYEPISSDDEL